MEPTTLKTSIMTVTPELAAKWLAKNDNYRKLREEHAGKLARDMRAGKWTLNGEAIKFNGEKLVDGQHRLQACVIAKKPFKTLVVTGVKSDMEMDSGMQRKFCDYLAHEGHANARSLAASLALLHHYENTGLGQRVSRRSATNSDLQRQLKKHPNLAEWVTMAILARHVIPVGIAAALCYLFGAVDRAMAERFVEALRTGEGLTKRDPVLMLRERLIKDQQSRTKMGRIDKMALVIKAWNHWRRGSAPEVLIWRGSGPAAEAFPEIE